MSWWNKVSKISNTVLEYKSYQKYSDVWFCIRNEKYKEALDKLAYVPKGGKGYPKSEIYTTKGYIFFGLANYNETVKFLKHPVSLADDKSLKNTPNSPISLKEKTPDIYYKYGIALWKIGKKKKAARSLMKAYKNNKKNLWYILKIILLYSEEGDYYNIDFYTEFLCEKYNPSRKKHREQFHNYLQRDDLWKHFPQSQERFLRKLREKGLIDDHFLHSKIRKKRDNISNQESKEKLIGLLIENEIISVLEELFLLSTNKPDIFNQVIILYNNYNKVQADIRAGVISKADENLDLNKIKLSTIQLINDL